MESLLRDVRYALRTLWRAPGFTAVAGLTLALGIGANTAIFSVVNAVLLRPLPYADADRLVAVFEGERGPTSPATFLELRAQREVYAEAVAAHPWSPVLRGDERPEQLRALKASPELFHLLGARAVLGRTFSEAGTAVEQTTELSVVLGHALWQRRFGGDPAVVGQTLSLDGVPYTVLGVMPPGFEFPPFWATGAELWAPIVFDPARAAERDARFLRVFARLAPDVDRERAQAATAAVARRLIASYPEANAGMALRVEPLLEPVVDGVRSPLAVLLGAVGLVLLIACANVASLFLARASTRRREIAVRSALGAGRGGLVRQLLTESLVLAALAGVAGAFLGVWGVAALTALAPPDLPRLTEVGLDGRVFAFTLALSLMTGALFGVFPALRVLRWDLGEPLRAGSRQPASDGGRARTLLVIAEICLALMLLVGAGLTLRSLAGLWRLDPGFRSAGVLTLDLSLAGSPFAAPERQGPFFDELLAEVRSVPGVAGAGLINHLPIGGDRWGTRFQIEGERAPSAAESPRAAYRVVSPELFAALGVPLRRGRGFDARDRADAAPVVLVNQALAARYFAGRDPIGARLQQGGPDSQEPWREVVGVVGDVKAGELTAAPEPEIYFPYAQNPDPWWTGTTLVVYTTGDSLALRDAALRDAVEERVWALDPGVPVAARTMSEVLARARGRHRFNTVFLALFAALAVVLAAVGIYGVMSYAVARRRGEISVRMALGAGRGQILRLLLGQGLALAAAGVAAGVAGALAFARVLGALLYGVGTHDAATYFAVSLLLTAVALLAAYVPARRASRLDPAAGLRGE